MIMSVNWSIPRIENKDIGTYSAVAATARRRRRGRTRARRWGRGSFARWRWWLWSRTLRLLLLLLFLLLLSILLVILIIGDIVLVTTVCSVRIGSVVLGVLRTVVSCAGSSTGARRCRGSLSGWSFRSWRV